MVTTKAVQAANIPFVIDQLRKNRTGNTLEGIVFPSADQKSLRYSRCQSGRRAITPPAARSSEDCVDTYGDDEVDPTKLPGLRDRESAFDVLRVKPKLFSDIHFERFLNGPVRAFLHRWRRKKRRRKRTHPPRQQLFQTEQHGSRKNAPGHHASAQAQGETGRRKRGASSNDTPRSRS
jgi:hypothetical protein